MQTAAQISPLMNIKPTKPLGSVTMVTMAIIKISKVVSVKWMSEMSGNRVFLDLKAVAQFSPLPICERCSHQRYDKLRLSLHLLKALLITFYSEVT